MVILLPTILAEFFIALAAVGFAFALIAAFAALFAAVGVALARLAIAFSRISLGLLIGFSISQSTSLMGMTGWANFACWSAIALVIIFAMCRFPRISQAVTFLATAFISYLVITVCVAISAGVVCIFIDKTFSFTLGNQITIMVVSLLLAAFATLKDMTNHTLGDLIELSNPVFVNIERLAASAISGFGGLILLDISISSAWDIAFETHWPIAVIIGAIAFMVDVFLPRTPLLKIVRNISLGINNKTKTPAQKRSEMIDSLK